MLPSSDDIFDILIKIQLQSGLYEEYSINPSFHADISFKYIFIFKYRSYGNTVFVKQEWIIPRTASTLPVTEGSVLPKVSFPCIFVGNTWRSSFIKWSFTRAIAALTRGCSRKSRNIFILSQIFLIVNVKFSMFFGIPHNFCQNLWSVSNNARSLRPKL